MLTTRIGAIWCYRATTVYLTEDQQLLDSRLRRLRYLSIASLQWYRYLNAGLKGNCENNRPSTSPRKVKYKSLSEYVADV